MVFISKDSSKSSLCDLYKFHYNFLWICELGKNIIITIIIMYIGILQIDIIIL